MSDGVDRDWPLFEAWPRLAGKVPRVPLGEFPTPVQSLDAVAREVGCATGRAWVKRDDVSSPRYGGNKVRVLEVLFGDAVRRGATHIYTTGAYGSNHAVAMLLHAPVASLESGVVLFAQPPSFAALENLRVTLTCRPVVHSLPHWSLLPLGVFLARRAARRRGDRPYVMMPGGATPLGALGYVSAAFELAAQVRAGALPVPRTIVVGVGSTCTTAGLLVGTLLAARRGFGFVGSGSLSAPPRIVSARVTPWPVTSRSMILRLAVRTARKLADLAEDDSLALGRDELGAQLEVEGRFLGRGYGYPTPSGLEALSAWHAAGAHELDTTYSAKSAAAVVARMKDGAPGPILFWSTKSTAPLPDPDPAALAAAPGRLRRWMDGAERGIERGLLPGPTPWDQRARVGSSKPSSAR